MRTASTDDTSPARWELDGVDGAVVVDVIRAFTTAADAFGSGASEIYLVGTVEEALEFKRVNPRGTGDGGGEPLDAAATASALRRTDEAARALALGPAHTDPLDIELAAAVDVFDFAMEVHRTDLDLRLVPIWPSAS